MATVIAINICENKGGPWHCIPEGFFKKDWGLEGDAHAGLLLRQVTLFGIESIRKMELSGMEGLCTARFTGNIITDGIVLYGMPVGTRFTIGCCGLEVSQVGKECCRYCTVSRQPGGCILPREVIFARVTKSGLLTTGDELTVLA